MDHDAADRCGGFPIASRWVKMAISYFFVVHSLVIGFCAAMEDFGDYLEEKEGQQVSFFVYNSARDSVRFVSLEVSQREWGPAERLQTGLGE